MFAPVMLAIVGGSAAGKGTLAAALATLLPGKVQRLELDAFYRDQSHRPLRVRAGLNFDHPAAIDWPRVRQVFDALRAGKSAGVPEYDFATHTRKPAGRWCPPAPFVVWDGLWLLDWSWLGRAFDFSVYVECEPALCLARRLRRDVAERGRRPASVTRQYLDAVLPMQRRFVDRQRLWADAVLRSPWPAGTLPRLVARLQTSVAVRKAAVSSWRTCG
jgi:uridine kinase